MYYSSLTAAAPASRTRVVPWIRRMATELSLVSKELAGRRSDDVSLGTAVGQQCTESKGRCSVKSGYLSSGRSLAETQ